MDTILCDELLQEIFHHLPPPSSSAVSLVSKRWRHLLRSSLSSLSLRLSPNHPSLPSLSSFLSHHTSLSTLSVSSSSAGTTVFSGDLLRSISAASPQLLSLSIILSRPLLSLQLLTSFTNLKSLTLTLAGNASPDSVSDEFTVSSSLRLQSLRLSGICAGDYSLNWLWKNCDCKTLTKLVLENCEGVGDNSSFACFVKGLENVREVELKTCSLVSLLVYDGGSKESLLRFVRETTCDLRRLDLRLPLDLDDTHLFQIGVKFSRMRVLRLQSCCMVTGEGLKTLGLALSDNLEELALTNCDVINGQDGFLVELAQNLKKIKILDLSYNHTLLDKEFASMISSYCNLRKLKLRGCSRLTNVSLILLCKNCKRLESVDILYCNGIQVEGVEFLILNSRQLRNLQVEDRKLSEAARRWMTDKFIEVQH
ncbi:putative F-box domain, leucine-rich repeat domain superfamily, F-box-like domain superfamily [Helianthus annuus]|nr:putative F-box domain, leucine-rich repeat domain superfamily, F-box-like domain superfamily [Helianthus annuus]